MRCAVGLFARVLASLAAVLAASAAPAQSGLFNRFKNVAAPPQQVQGQNQGEPGQSAQPGKPQPPGQAGAPPSAVDSPMGAFTAPAGTKLEVLTLGPMLPAYASQVSPAGAHVATRAMSGSRRVAIYDGATGPKFDEISGSFIFSPDGSRWAYCGRVGPTWHYMVDGKDTLQTPAGGCFIGFTSNSRHVWFLVTEKNATRFYFDGKPGPAGAPTDPRSYVFSPDGNRFAYVGYPNPGARRSKNQLVIDGMPAPYDGGDPQWSADSQQLFTKRQAPSRTAWDVLLDGQPIMRADNVTLAIPPVGNMVVAKVLRNGSPSSTQLLIIGDREVPGSETTGQIGPISFSPDGKHYAAEYNMGNGRNWIFADGKKGQEYQALIRRDRGGAGGYAVFTADSSRMVYEAVGSDPTTEFLIIDGQESEQIRSVGEFVLAPVGNHIATAGAGQVTMDGALLKYPNVDIGKSRAGLLSFSPDASHFAFRLGWSLYLDGKEQTGFVPSLMGALANINNAAYVWSPDGKHIAYFCHSAASAVGDDTYLCIDDKALHVGANASELNLLFSADSKHLFWARALGQDKYRVYVDGKAVYDGARAITMDRQCWQAAADGSLVAVLQDGTSIKRIKITPSPSFSVATLLATAVPNAR